MALYSLSHPVLSSFNALCQPSPIEGLFSTPSGDHTVPSSTSRSVSTSSNASVNSTDSSISSSTHSTSSTTSHDHLESDGRPGSPPEGLVSLRSLVHARNEQASNTVFVAIDTGYLKDSNFDTDMSEAGVAVVPFQHAYQACDRSHVQHFIIKENRHRYPEGELDGRDSYHFPGQSRSVMVYDLAIRLCAIIRRHQAGGKHVVVVCFDRVSEVSRLLSGLGPARSKLCMLDMREICRALDMEEESQKLGNNVDRRRSLYKLHLIYTGCPPYKIWNTGNAVGCLMAVLGGLVVRIGLGLDCPSPLPGLSTV